jgi:oxygen-independent coproporphyrinogen-3 oxidase
MGLRLTEGIDPDRFRLLRGRGFEAARIEALVEENLIEICADKRRLRVTPKGFPVLDAIVADLAA